MKLSRIVGQEIPRIVPPNWDVADVMGQPIARRLDASGLKMMFSIDTLEDGKRWSHFSISRRDRYPGWDEMVAAIRACPFLDPERDVVMVIPPAKEYVNYHPNCFHWWQEVR